MYKVIKRIEVAGAHFLNLPYKSKCADLHGHNWIIDVEVEASELNASGMVLDFTIIKEVVGQLDHTNLNEMKAFSKHNPTAENIAEWIASQINAELVINKNGNLYATVSKIMVQESEGNTACYIA